MTQSPTPPQPGSVPSPLGYSRESQDPWKLFAQIIGLTAILFCSTRLLSGGFMLTRQTQLFAGGGDDASRLLQWLTLFVVFTAWLIGLVSGILCLRLSPPGRVGVMIAAGGELLATAIGLAQSIWNAYHAGHLPADAVHMGWTYVALSTAYAAAIPVVAIFLLSRPMMKRAFGGT